MDMNEWYYLKGKMQQGPFTIEELKSLGLSSDTLVWAENMETWTKIKDIPVLLKELKSKKTPPPPPMDDDDKVIKTEIQGTINIAKVKEPNQVVEALKPTRTGLRNFIIWTAFHLFALLMSYSRVEIFNDRGKPSSSEFWPFVDYQYCQDKIEWNDDYNGMYKTGRKTGTSCRFYGFFNNYDITEFLLYVGGAFVVFLIAKSSHSKEEKINELNNEHTNDTV